MSYTKFTNGSLQSIGDSTITQDKKRKERNELLFKVLFGFLAVMGQVSQNTALPLWMDAGSVPVGNCTTMNQTDTNSTCPMRTMDSYFVYSFASLWFEVIFGIILIVLKIIKPDTITKNDLKFPVKNLILVGFFYSLNGAMVVFASNPDRTPPYLQAILGNFIIPWTVMFRFILLRKAPTLKKGLCAAAVLVSLIICVLPDVIPSLGGDTKVQPENTANLILWPMIFMLGFTPLAMVNVLEEKILKDERNINIIYFIFCLTTFQGLTALGLFWLDILPWYGNAKNLTELWDNWAFGASCFFGGSGCSGEAGVRGMVFVLGCIFMYYGSAMLVRYAEGAVLLAVVTSLVTPIGFLFWSLFQAKPFMFKPNADIKTWFALGALTIMIPSIFFYNFEIGRKKEKEEDEQSVLSSNENSYSQDVFVN